MKVKTSIKQRCNKCEIIRRRSKSGVMRIYVYCSNRRHNQRQG